MIPTTGRSFDMPHSKNQMRRLVKFVSEMRQNKYPNAKNFSDSLRNAGLYDGNEREVCVKTIHRDIATLKNEFNAPIEFDRARNGYYLSNHGWELQMPILDDAYIMASALGAKLARDLTPQPLRGEIEDAVDEMLSTNNTDFLDEAYVSSLIAASGVKVEINPIIFKIVFAAWQGHLTLALDYVSANGKARSFKFNPHALVYYNSAWYMIGEEPSREDSPAWTYAIHRIATASLTEKKFEPDMDIIAGAQAGRIFHYDEIENAEVWCAASIAGYVREQFKIRGERIVESANGSIILQIPRIHKHELIKWILSEGGQAKLVKPEAVAAEIGALALKAAAAHAAKS